MIVKTYSVFCDGDNCLRWAAETVDGVAEARKIAKSWGWVRKNKLDLCPVCAKAV